MNRIIKLMITFSYAVTLFICNSLTAFAEVVLPEGVVAGLPEKLSVLDSDGNSVSEQGEYFFIVEDMQPYETYSKDIQIMNLREDKAYHIYFYAEPIAKQGEIDLEEECTAVFTLNDTQIFEGKVTGESTDSSINLSEEPIDLGLYEPGQSGILNCSVIWNSSEFDGTIDYGNKIIDSEGTEIIRDGDTDISIYGEVTFRWIFYAVVDEDYKPPKTGIISGENIIYIIAEITIVVIILILLLLILFKRKGKKV